MSEYANLHAVVRCAWHVGSGSEEVDPDLLFPLMTHSHRQFASTGADAIRAEGTIELMISFAHEGGPLFTTDDAPKDATRTGSLFCH